MSSRENTIEVVKTIGGEVVHDEYYALCQCPGCGMDVARGWLHCPSCGGALPYGELPVVKTCRNVGDSTVFECSECGRKYVPVQIRGKDESGPVDWRSCPGCGTAVEA